MCLFTEFFLLLVQSLHVAFFWFMQLGTFRETELVYASGLWPRALSGGCGTGSCGTGPEVRKFQKMGTTEKRRQLRSDPWALVYITMETASKLLVWTQGQPGWLLDAVARVLKMFTAGSIRFPSFTSLLFWEWTEGGAAFSTQPALFTLQCFAKAELGLGIGWQQTDSLYK